MKRPKSGSGRSPRRNQARSTWWTASLFAAVLIVITALAAQSEPVRTPLAPGGPDQSASTGGGEKPSLDGATPIFGKKSISVGSFDRSLRKLEPVAQPNRPTSEAEGERTPVVRTGVSLKPAATTTSTAPTPSLSFDGISSVNGAGTPPDPHGDVGPNHYIEAVNSSIGIYNKATGALSTPIVNFNTFMSAGGLTGACSTSNMGDPYILYDRISGRWIITDFAFSNSNGPFYECIAVSKTESPVTGGWWTYSVLMSSTYMADYPKFSAWADGIYMTSNLFDGDYFFGIEIDVFNRADLISGVAEPRNQWLRLGDTNYSLLPVNDESGLATGPALFISDYPSLRVWEMSIDWSNSANSSLSDSTDVSGVAAYSEPDDYVVPQRGSNLKLDSLGDRLMSAAQWTNASGTPAIWVSRTYDAGSKGTGIYWAEVRGLSSTPTIYQQMLYSSSSSSKWLPSLAVDRAGNMALLYSYASSSIYPSLAYAGRKATAALGTLDLGERSIASGLSAATSSWQRWGDYFSVSIDPVNDCTFWMVGEYMSAGEGARWNTRIAKTVIPGCLAAPVNSSVPTTPTAPEANTAISADPGVWSGSPTFAYAWYSCSSAGAATSSTPSGCSSISSATSVDYTPSSAVAGQRLRVKVTATNETGSSSYYSAATDVVIADPANSTAPSVSGTAKVGSTLTANKGTWSGYPTPEYAYQWVRCAGADSQSRSGAVESLPGTCTLIDGAGAIAPTYVSGEGDFGNYLRVRVTATNSGGSVAYFSKTTAIIVGGAPSNSSAPTLSGTPQVAQVITADPGIWGGYPTPSGTYTYTWYQCKKVVTASGSSSSSCSKISGASGPTLNVTSAYRGKYLRVQVTATSGGGTTSWYSATTAKVN